MKERHYTVVSAVSERDGKPIHVKDFVYTGIPRNFTLEEARILRYNYQKDDDTHYYKVVEC